MSPTKRIRRWTGVLSVAFLLLSLTVAAGLAQVDAQQENPEETQDQPVVQQAPPPAPRSGPDPGPFRRGRVRVGFYGGAGSTLGQTYLILGAGAGYYLLDGLEAGFDVEGWLLQTPNIWKLTPQIRYVLWQIQPIRPYAGVFWRQTYVGDDWPDYDSWGARGGVAYRKGGNYLAVGLVYEKFNGYTGSGDDYVVYPEFAFWLSF